MRVWYKKSDTAHFCLLLSCSLFLLLCTLLSLFTLYHYTIILQLSYYSVDGRHTTRTRPGKLHTATGRCSGQRTAHALVAYSGMDEEPTGFT